MRANVSTGSVTTHLMRWSPEKTYCRGSFMRFVCTSTCSTNSCGVATSNPNRLRYSPRRTEGEPCTRMCVILASRRSGAIVQGKVCWEEQLCMGLNPSIPHTSTTFQTAAGESQPARESSPLSAHLEAVHSLVRIVPSNAAHGVARSVL
jgi:hypothetical protein